MGYGLMTVTRHVEAVRLAASADGLRMLTVTVLVADTWADRLSRARSAAELPKTLPGVANTESPTAAPVTVAMKSMDEVAPTDVADIANVPCSVLAVAVSSNALLDSSNALLDSSDALRVSSLDTSAVQDANTYSG